MRIAYFTDTYAPQVNGIVNTFNYLTNYLRKHGIEHLIFAPDFESEHQSEDPKNVIRSKGFRPLIYPECSLSIPNYFSVKNRIKAFNPDVIHITTEFGIGFCGLRVAQDLNIPIIMSYHTNFDQYLDKYRLQYLHRPYWSYMRWFHNFALVNLCPSNQTVSELNKHRINNPEICSHGIDTDHFNPSYRSETMRDQLGGNDKLLLLYVGRLAKEKGLDTLIRSIHAINQKYQHEVQFIFTGDGPYKKELLQANIPNAVFTGIKQKHELGMIYASCDIFMFPSGTETFGNVVLEAMGSGLPVVCTDSGGITDFTQHMQNAYVCRFKNSRSLASGLSHLICDPTLRDRLRRNGLITAGLRNWNAIFETLLTQYEFYAHKQTDKNETQTENSV